MCDLESYSVVQIRESHWSTLQLLWWHASVSLCGGEAAGMNGAHPALVLAFGQKETRVCIGMDKLAVLRASSLYVTIAHRAVVVPSGYVQQCSARLSLPESR